MSGFRDFIEDNSQNIIFMLTVLGMLGLYLLNEAKFLKALGFETGVQYVTTMVFALGIFAIVLNWVMVDDVDSGITFFKFFGFILIVVITIWGGLEIIQSANTMQDIGNNYKAFLAGETVSGIVLLIYFIPLVVLGAGLIKVINAITGNR